MVFGRILTSQSAARLARARHISSLELAAVGDHDRLGGRARARADGLDLLDDVHALGHGAEDDVLAVEPVGLDRAEEEPARVPSTLRFFYRCTSLGLESDALPLS